MKTTVIRTWMLICVCLFTWNASAQYSTRFLVTEVEDESLGENINLAVSDLLTKFNVAEHEGRVPDLTNINITPEAIGLITKLWADCPFTCMDDQIVERVTVLPSKELQIRNIRLIMKPVDGESKNISWKKYQEGVITLDSTGRITNFHLAVDPELYISVMGSAKAVEDVERRTLILEYVERFRNAYNLKDMNFLQQIYSDDALIITGKVIKQVKNDSKMANVNDVKIEYSRQDKKTYLKNLKEKVFDVNKRVNVIFDEIKVARHPVNEAFYGVTLKQGWETDRYSDVGWLFLLWDFTNPEAPQIHVRTWQPTEINNEPVALPEEDIFTIEDFDI